ncbi:MAG: hypothetical protein ACLR7D_09490 [Lachnospira eligens]
MDNFANIGKAAIIQSLGIQKNYTEVIETTVDAIDYSNTACSTCNNTKLSSIHLMKIANLMLMPVLPVQVVHIRH